MQYSTLIPTFLEEPLKCTAALCGCVLFVVLLFRNLLSFHAIVENLRKTVTAWAYLFDGPTIIRHGFQKSEGAPFKVQAPDVQMTFVSTPQQIKEVDGASDATLSLNGAAKHVRMYDLGFIATKLNLNSKMLQPLYTMNGFNWFDRRGVEGVGFVRVLRTLLTNNLPKLLPDLSILARDRWQQLIDRRGRSQGDGAITVPIYPVMMDLVVSLNARSLFGEDIAKDDAFIKSALGYVEETLITAEIVKLVPRLAAPFVGRFLGFFFSSHRTFFRSLIPMTQDRIQDNALRKLGRPIPSREDCVQWIIDTAPKQNPWPAERVIYELMAIWFGSVHILSTTIVYAIHDLCLHPEYIQPLRDELQSSYSDFKRTGLGLPLLDSFLKESARLTPVESMSVRHCALRPFALADGTKLGVGEWICAPSAVINTEASYYPLPYTFSGFRFVDSEVLRQVDHCGCTPIQQPRSSKLTDVDHSYLMWGTGRMACPGRFYASAFMKTIVAQLLLHYDFNLMKPEAPRWISWRVAKIPRPWTKLALTPRDPGRGA